MGVCAVAEYTSWKKSAPTVQAFISCTSRPDVCHCRSYKHPWITCPKMSQAHQWPTPSLWIDAKLWGHLYIYAQETWWQYGVRSCIMYGLPTHLVQELNVSTEDIIRNVWNGILCLWSHIMPLWDWSWQSLQPVTKSEGTRSVQKKPHHFHQSTCKAIGASDLMYILLWFNSVMILWFNSQIWEYYTA